MERLSAGPDRDVSSDPKSVADKAKDDAAHRFDDNDWIAAAGCGCIPIEQSANAGPPIFASLRSLPVFTNRRGDADPSRLGEAGLTRLDLSNDAQTMRMRNRSVRPQVSDAPPRRPHLDADGPGAPEMKYSFAASWADERGTRR